MKLHYFFLTLSLSILYSCDNAPKDLEPFMVDISDFQLDKNALKDGEIIEILGSSGNLTREHVIDFYNLVVVKSLKTGDTVNVLETSFYQSNLNDPKEIFISNSSVIGKLLENAVDGTDNLDINDLTSKTYEKVFYDDEYIQVDVRKYPAIPGSLGNYTIEGELDDLSDFFN